ncbi:MAG: fatty acid biosynthesis transcriptional regulator [Oscillospiraceae bacterium]|nr:fatty acid biosynthesis transcriptional regulator [Oscillospiraceae bacterium]
MNRESIKKQRHVLLAEKIRQNPFLKDEELAKDFSVSVATIRFDRAELGISEYRERVKMMAKDGYNAEKISPEVIDINPMHDAVSVLETKEIMTWSGTDIVKGQEIFAFAENTAMNVLGAKVTLIKVANVKYFTNVKAGEKLIARSEVKRVKDNEYIVWVKIKSNMNDVFRGKFMLEVSENISEK